MKLRDIGRFETVIIALIVISLAGKFFLIPLNQGMWWDEAVYLGLGRGITEGRYSMWPDTTIESFRPPLFPFIVSPFFDSPITVRIIAALISVAAVFLVYKTIKDSFGKRPALWGALLLSTSYHFVFFSTKALSETLSISLFALSFMFFIKWTCSGNRWHILIAGVFTGLTFLTRYLNSLILVSYLLVLIYISLKRKERKTIYHLIIFLAGMIIPLIPWFLLNIANYGSPFAAFSVNYLVYTSSLEADVMPLLTGLGSVFGITGLIMIPGLFFVFRDSKRDNETKLLLLLLFSLPFVFYFLSPHREPRYFLSFFVVYAMLAGIGAARINERLDGKLRGGFKAVFSAALVVITIIILVTSLSFVWAERIGASAIVSASQELRDLTQPGENVFGISYPYIYYLSDRNVITYCGVPDTTDKYFVCRKRVMDNGTEPESLNTLLNWYNINYLLIYKFELENPPYADTYFDESPDFIRIKSYYQWGDPDAAVIYEYVGS